MVIRARLPWPAADSVDIGGAGRTRRERARYRHYAA